MSYGHLVRSASGHLVRSASGHLVHSREKVTLSYAGGPQRKQGTDWTWADTVTEWKGDSRTAVALASGPTMRLYRGAPGYYVIDSDSYSTGSLSGSYNTAKVEITTYHAPASHCARVFFSTSKTNWATISGSPYVSGMTSTGWHEVALSSTLNASGTLYVIVIWHDIDSEPTPLIPTGSNRYITLGTTLYLH